MFFVGLKTEYDCVHIPGCILSRRRHSKTQNSPTCNQGPDPIHASLLCFVRRPSFLCKHTNSWPLLPQAQLTWTCHLTPPPVPKPTALSCSHSGTHTSMHAHFYHTCILCYTQWISEVGDVHTLFNAFAQGKVSHLSIQTLTIPSPVQSTGRCSGVSVVGKKMCLECQKDYNTAGDT